MQKKEEFLRSGGKTDIFCISEDPIPYLWQEEIESGCPDSYQGRTQASVRLAGTQVSQGAAQDSTAIPAPGAV